MISKRLTAVKQRDLSSPHDFLSLAEWHLAAGQPDEAVSWAERGLRAFPTRMTTPGCRISSSRRTSRRVVTTTPPHLIWEQFARSQTSERYLSLKTHASQTREGWRVWRERALDLTRAALSQTALSARVAGRTCRTTASWWNSCSRTRAYEAAWQEAQAGECRPELWLQLAERREHSHPADALRVYQTRLGPIIAQGGPQAYKEAIGLLNKISALLEEMGRAAEVGVYRAEVRATHRQKRSFLKLLDASGH